VCLCVCVCVRARAFQFRVLQHRNKGEKYSDHLCVCVFVCVCVLECVCVCKKGITSQESMASMLK